MFGSCLSVVGFIAAFLAVSASLVGIVRYKSYSDLFVISGRFQAEIERIGPPPTLESCTSKWSSSIRRKNHGASQHAIFRNLLPMKPLLLSLIAALFAGAALAAGAGEDPNRPREFWWYWDRPAAQLPPPAPGVGAAVLVTHVIFSGQGYILQPRRSALRLPQGTATMPVVHVEVDPARAFAANAAQSDALRAAVLDAVRRGSSTWVQLDFEARRSQRAFWRTAVHSIKAALPAGVRLSVTALASWCYGDRWIGDAPVDEIVPMYFRLRQTRRDYILRSAAGVSEARCASAYGVADDEPDWPVALPGRRFVFLGQRGRLGTDLIADFQGSYLP